MDTNRLQQVLTSNATLQSAEITYLQQEIAALDQAIATATSKRAMYNTLLSPLRRSSIPPEVLGEIFSHVVLVDTGSELKAHQRLRVLCLVCKAWRQAAIASPRLWCNLERFPLYSRVPSHFDRAEVWLKRGGTLPKCIELVEMDHDYDERAEGDSSEVALPTAPCPVSNASLADLLTRIPSLDGLSIAFLGMQCLKRLCDNLERVQGPEPRLWDSLRSLNFEIECEGRGESDLHGLDILPRLSSSLTNLKLDLPCLLDTPNDPPPLSSNSLVTLELSLISWPTHWILHSTESCPNLQSLVIDLVGVDADLESVGPDYPAKQQYELPHLHTLRFRQIRDRKTTTQVLRLLKIPSLTELDISFDFRRHAFQNAEDLERNYLFKDFGDDMRVFMKKSGCISTLRRARIHAIHLPWSTLKVVLDTLRPVTHLTLDEVWAYWSTDPWSTWPNTLLPRLESLEVLNVDHTFDDQCILSFVQKRASQRGGGALKRVRMTMHQKPILSYPAMCDAAEQLEKLGVEVEIELTNPNDSWSEAKVIGPFSPSLHGSSSEPSA